VPLLWSGETTNRTVAHRTPRRPFEAKRGVQMTISDWALLRSSSGFQRASMIDDSPPHRVFKIGELATLIASQLLVISQESAVNLACSCRYLEGLVLSVLWETQDSLGTLLKVLPKETWVFERRPFYELVVRDLGLPSEELNAQVWGCSVQDGGGSVARGLEQSPSLRVVDASRPRGRATGPRRRDLPQVTP